MLKAGAISGGLANKFGHRDCLWLSFCVSFYCSYSNQLMREAKLLGNSVAAGKAFCENCPIVLISFG